MHLIHTTYIEDHNTISIWCERCGLAIVELIHCCGYVGGMIDLAEQICDPANRCSLVLERMNTHSFKEHLADDHYRFSNVRSQAILNGKTASFYEFFNGMICSECGALAWNKTVSSFDGQRPTSCIVCSTFEKTCSQARMAKALG